ncbi:hypothetical protein SAMN05421823_10624 [Catalinimonas alkaloidigena]|uniref:Uncharacterized protein n=1 Tax=Catalinimonas alkaloidigena TaxID=1075417 RepID=A0A1G9K1K0_9BACT|nr:hypothetical protein [Catalinimonas alkaloidigena]SDL43800.1 hypothetical protein SAMN05421823_10624 [Catalinimonas alkaloidigena]
MKYLPIFFLLFILFVQCSQPKKKLTDVVKIHSLANDGTISQTDTLYWQTTHHDGYISTKYGQNPDPNLDLDTVLIFYDFRQMVGNDSSIEMFSESCRKLGSATYPNLTGQDSTAVTLFLYDDPARIDEEMIFFFDEDLRLLMTYDLNWRYVYELYEYDSTSFLLYRQILEDSLHRPHLSEWKWKGLKETLSDLDLEQTP